MLVGADILNRIDEIVEQAYTTFLFDLIGDRFFNLEQKRKVESLGLIIGRRPLIELLYMLVRIRSSPRYRTDKTLTELLDEVARTGILPALNDTQLYTLDHAKIELNESLQSVKNDLKKKVSKEIAKINEQYKNDIAISRVSTIPDRVKLASHYSGLLLAAVAALAPSIQSNFNRLFTGNLTNFINNSVVDEVLTRAGLSGKKDIKVYKVVKNDDHLCQWCEKFYLAKDGNPKIYDLKILQANGTNEGKPRSQWKPVLGLTHNRCRCQLHYIED